MTRRSMAALVAQALLLLLVPVSSQAEMSINDYRRLSGGDKGAQEAIQLYLAGVLDGFSTANAILKDSERRPLFCSPQGLPLQVSNARQLIDKELSQRGKDKSDAVPVSIILMFSLEELFPCPD